MFELLSVLHYALFPVLARWQINLILFDLS